MRRAVAAAALSASLVTGTAIGATIFAPNLVGAQSDPTTTTTTPAAEDHADWMRSALQPLVDNSTITAAQRDAVITALQAAHPGKGDGDHFGGRMGGLGFGFGGGMLGDAADAVAKAIGIDAATLRSEMEAGKSIADIAKAHNVDPQTVIDAAVAAATASIDKAVADGTMTAEQAARIKSMMAEHADDIVNGTLTGKSGMGRGGMFPGGRGARSGDSGTTSDTATTTA